MIGRLFKLHSRKQHADSLAHYLPGGRLFAGKFNDDSELRKLLLGLAAELARAEQNISDYNEERDITRTTQLIEEWESAVGIPDGCFNGDGDLDERRMHVLIKFAMSAQHHEDFEKIGRLLGVSNMVVRPLVDDPIYTDPDHPEKFTLPQARFITVVRGVGVQPGVPPYDVPFIPTTGSSIVQCLFERLKPANVRFIYEEDRTASEFEYNDWAERVGEQGSLGF